MKFKSIRLKIALCAGICLLMTSAVIVGYASITMKREAEYARARAIENAQTVATQIAEKTARKIQVEMEVALDAARTMAQMLSGVKDEQLPLKLNRDNVNSMLSILLDRNPQFLGTYTCWEANAFDGDDESFRNTPGHDATGRFVPYWNRSESGAVAVEPLMAYDVEGDGDYYLLPKKTGRECLIDPYVYPIQGEEILLTSLVVPIAVNDQFYGIAGIDISLSFLQEIANDVEDLYDGDAKIVLISHGGTLAGVTGQDDLVGKGMQEVYAEYEQHLKTIQSGEMAVEMTTEDGLAVFVPMQLGLTGKPWSVNIVVPEKNIVEQADAQMHRAVTKIAWMVCIAGVFAVLALVVLWIVARGVTRPIVDVTMMLKDISEGKGDLTRRLQSANNDEVGQMSSYFNLFIEKIQKIILQVADMSREVTAAATEIAASSDQMSSGMSEQNQQMTQMASAIEQMNQSVTEVAKKSSDAANNATRSGDVARKGGEVVGNTIAGMESITEAVRASSASVTELGERGKQIGQVIEVINDIADQTNLLALNAAIEAARAGEHGRGFAVVADEVRKLADRTTKATEEVGESIEAIQKETNLAVERMDSGTKQVAAGVELASEAGESLKEIVASSGEVAEMIQAIAAAAEEQSASSEELSRNVESVSSVTQQSSEGAGQTATAANELSCKAEQLMQLVGQFKVD